MTQASRFTRVTGAVLASIGLLWAGAAAHARPPTADELLLRSSFVAGSDWAPTSTVVTKDRFSSTALTYQTGITDVRFAVEKIRTDVITSERIAPPLRMKRNGIKWDEYNMLVSGRGFNQGGRFPTGSTYPIGRQEGMGRDMNVRVMIPRDGWNGRLVFWHHGSADTSLLTFVPLLETELLLSRGWAVAAAHFNGAAPPQQNPHATDDSYWKWVDEMYLADEANYWSYDAHPDWWSNVGGVAIGDGATLRNLAGLVKNLIRHERGQAPSRSYWVGWSAGGPAGTAVNTGRDPAGNYTGGNFNVPYDKTTGKVFDAFVALEPVFSRTAPVDRQFPITAPHVFLDGDVTLLSLSAPNAINFARKVKLALDGAAADSSLAKDINAWTRLYMQKYGNHDWMGRFFETVYSGDDKDDLYYDRSLPMAERFNTQGQGRKLNWVMSKMYRTSPKYTIDWANEQKPGWGQLTFAYDQLNDAYHMAMFDQTVRWVEQGVAPATSRIDPHLLNPATTTHPGLPTNDFRQDSLDRAVSALGLNLADVNWQRTDPGALAVVPSMVEMPNLKVRYGVFWVGYKTLTILPFTPSELTGGYNFGNVAFAGYANRAAYDQAWTQAVQNLVTDGFYDPHIASIFLYGDPGTTAPHFD
jgi:hypothetical protein